MSYSVLQETLMGVWAQAEQARQRENEPAKERESARKRKTRRSEGKPVENKGTSSPDTPWSWGQTKPLTWTHTGEGEEELTGGGNWVRGQGVRQVALSFFFVCYLRWQKNTTVWTREWIRNSWPADWWRDRRGEARSTHLLPPLHQAEEKVTRL